MKVLKSDFSKRELVLFFAFYFSLLAPFAFAVKSFFLLIGIQSNLIELPLTLYGSFILSLYLIKKNNIPKIDKYVLFALSSVFIFVLFLIVGYIYDNSFDGQWYHQDGIFLLSRSWNPFYDTYFIGNRETSYCDNLLNHYSKSSWFSASVIYSFFNHIQYAKGFHIISTFGSFFWGTYILYSFFGISKKHSIIFALLLAFTPLSVGQSFTFCVDGECSSYFLIILYMLIYFSFRKNDVDNFHFANFILISSYFANLKFTAAIYLAVILLFYLIYIVLERKKINFIRHLYLILSTGIVAILLLGYPTYVRNTISNGHPFYPLMGENNIGKSVAEVNHPANFLGKNRWEKFYLGTIAKPQYKHKKNDSTQTKKLFSFSSENINKPFLSNLPSESISGLGPFHGELVILMLIILIASLIYFRKKILYLLLIACLIFSLIIIDEFWQYRYAPQIWFLLMFGLIAFFKINYKFVKVFVNIVLILITINFSIFYYIGINYKYEITKQIDTELSTMKGKNVLIEPGWVMSIKERLIENNIKYTISKSDSTFKPFVHLNFGWKYKIIE